MSNKAAGKQDAKPALTPKLRFPEFRDAPGWEEIPIGKKVNLLSGYPFDGTEILDTPGGKRLLRGINITEGMIRHRPEIDRYYLGDTEGLGKYELQENDLVIGMDGSKVGKNSSLISPSDSGSLLIQRVARLRADNPISIKFIFQQINSTKFHSYVDRINTSSGIPHVSAKQIQDFHICFPSDKEQQKIAECLTSLDEVIAAQRQKLDALKTHKNGLMQQLFPREGETLPRLRFPEFQDAEEWVEDTLDEIATFRRGSFPQPYGLPEWYDENGGMPFIQVFDVGNNFRLKDKTKSKISKLGAEKSVFIPKGTLIVTLQGSIGRVAITHYDAYIDRTLLIFETFRRPIERGFFARLIQNLFDVEKEIAPGGIIKTITKEALSNFKVKLPTIEEKQRIADCLISLYDLITAQSDKLDALKTHKKGLMQQLFPNLAKE
jgi:type I restriction enzyme S subunit